MVRITFIVLSLIAALSFAQAQMEPKITFDRITLEMGGESYQVEFAQTFEQRARGLMYREQLCEDCGMFFKFSSARYASMWMKNTYIALDVAYIDRNGVIVDIKPLTPHSLESVKASKKVRYALEMNQGWFASHNIRVGDQIEINR